MNTVSFSRQDPAISGMGSGATFSTALEGAISSFRMMAGKVYNRTGVFHFPERAVGGPEDILLSIYSADRTVSEMADALASDRTMAGEVA